MENGEKHKKRYRIGIILAVTALLGFWLFNILLMYDISSQQAEEIGRMRVQNIASNFQRSLTQAENTLEHVGDDLEKMIRNHDSEEEIRQFLQQRKELEYGLSDGMNLNLFCVVDGKVMISGMETPADYVLQDRNWYKGLMAVEKGKVYISSTYKDAFTDNICFTVAKILGDGTTVVGIDYSVAEIQSYVSMLAGDSYGEAVIVDSNEVIVGSEDPELVGMKLSSALPQYRDVFLRILASNEDSMSLRTSKEGADSIIFCSRTENGWYLMCDVSSRLLYRDSYLQLMRSLTWAMALCIVVGVVFFVYVWRKRWRQTHSGRKEKKQKQQAELTVQEQRKYQISITAIFVVSMILTTVVCTRMAVNDSRIKMEEELRKYNYEVGDWVLEQKNILDMFQNVVAARPEILESYDGMVKFLDDITKHYPKISATYIANPDFAHGHPMVMNNGWVPEPDYVEEERVWYVGALTADDFNITEPYYDARTGEYCITFSKVVRSEQGEFYGVFAIDFYLDVLTDILGESYSEEGYAFLVDKNGLIIDHPNSEYEFSDEDSVNIHELVYDRLYSENGMVSFRDYDGVYRVGDSIEENASGFRVIVMKNWWSIYGNVMEYMLLFLVLFGICILAVNVVISKMIKWQWTANENLKEMANSAIRAEQAKSLFLSNMSHEIRTPINAVLGMNEMILRECGDEQLLSYAENIRSAGKTLLFLINDILDMSKIESGKMEIVPAEYELGNLLLDLWNVIFLKAQEKGLSISFHLAEDTPGVLYGDDVRIKQIATNLLTNAVKYTSQGSVEMNVSYERTAEKKLLLILAVKDTGMGIREEDLGRLFEQYRRLDEKKNRNIEGTGLGMNITMSLVKLMGGDMKVESTYQKGSVFTVTIPQGIVNEEPVGSFEEISKQRKQDEGGSRKLFEAPDASVLVVDDNAMNLSVFQALLKRNKVKIQTASSGGQCLELIQQEKFHIIFMDHMMPEMDGIETLHRIRAMSGHPNEDTPVIVLTANAIMGAKEMYLKEGFVDFLTKPIEGEMLEKMVMDYLPDELIRTGGEMEEEQQQTDTVEDAQEKEREERYLQEGISIRQGLTYAGGNMDVYLDLMGMFFREKEKQEQKTRGFLEEGNMADYAILVHGLKGNARMLGADGLADIAFEHEKAGKAGNLEYAREHWEELAGEWERHRISFENLYREFRGEEEEKYTRVTDGEILQIPDGELDEVIRMLDEFQTDEAVEKIKEWLASPLTEEMYAMLCEALSAVEDEFDADKAIAILKRERSQ